MGLTILGGKGFVGSRYVDTYYDPAIGNVVSVNARHDYKVYSKDVLYFISTVDNYNVHTDPYLDIDTNLTTLVDVLERWRKYQEHAGCDDGVFNFISSWFVYGDQEKPLGVKEDADCRPKGFYSITKRCAEQLLISYCETYGLKYRILRLGNVIGPGDPKVSAKKNALQYMVNLLAENKDVQVYGDGMFFRDYIHVQDCAEAIELVLTKGKTNEIYNVGNGLSWPFLLILKYAKQVLWSASKITFIEPKEFHKKVQIPTFYMDVTKLKELGYSPIYTGVDLYRTLIP